MENTPTSSSSQEETGADSGGDQKGASNAEEKPSQLATGDNLPQLQTVETRETHPLGGQEVAEELERNVESDHESNDSEADTCTENSSEFLFLRADENVVRSVVTATRHKLQEKLNQMEKRVKESKAKNQILHFEVGERSFSEDKEKRREEIIQLPSKHAVHGGSHVDGNLPGGTGPIQEPGSHPPTGRKIDLSDGQESVPARRHYNTTLDQSISDISTQRSEWEDVGARPGDRPPMQNFPLEPSLVDVSGIDLSFLARHSQDRSLRSLHQANAEQVLSNDSSLPGASYINSMMNIMESNRATPFAVDWQVVPGPDKNSRLGFSLSPPVPMGEYERGEALHGSAFDESGDGNSGLVAGRATNSDHLPSTSTSTESSGLLSNGADNGFLPESESTATSQNPLGNASTNSFTVTDDQVPSQADVCEPFCAESVLFPTNSENPMLDRSAESDSSEAVINSAPLALAQRTREVCAMIEREGHREREREREAGVSEEANGSLQGQACSEVPLPFADFTMESPALRQGGARAIDLSRGVPASVFSRWWCTCASHPGQVSMEDPICAQCFRHRYLGPYCCSRPSENCCVCQEVNEGSQTCSVRGIIIPERSDSGHDQCCICLEDVFDGSWILPCLHRVHSICLFAMIAMIRHGECVCPNCGHVFLWRG